MCRLAICRGGANDSSMPEKKERPGPASREPSPDEIRAVRHAGFADSIRHMKPRRRKRLMNTYLEQDERRERNVERLIEFLEGE